MSRIVLKGDSSRWWTHIAGRTYFPAAFRRSVAQSWDSYNFIRPVPSKDIKAVVDAYSRSTDAREMIDLVFKFAAMLEESGGDHRAPIGNHPNRTRGDGTGEGAEEIIQKNRGE
mgnify:CR=1 FL=1